MTAATGFTSWAAFSPAGDKTIVMGDMVLQEDQINPVMSTALENGIEVTALHNHFLWDTPKVMFMHIGGSGELDNLATASVRYLPKSKKPVARKPEPNLRRLMPVRPRLIRNPLKRLLAALWKKQAKSIKLPLVEPHRWNVILLARPWVSIPGRYLSAAMTKLSSIGDFAVLETELQGVLKALRGAGIAITTIHNHMIGESPRIIFLHYWGEGTANDLAKGFKSALDAQSRI